MNILELKRKSLGYTLKEGEGGEGSSGGSAEGNAARAGMGFAGTGSGLAGSGVGAASTGMGGGQMGENAGSPAASTFSPQAITLAKLAGFVPGFGAIAGIAGLGMSAVNAFGSGSSSGTTGGGMGDSSSAGGSGNLSAISGNLGSILDIAGGINSIFNQPSSTAAQTSGDPFAPYRAGLAAQYANALQPGSSTNIEAMPGYTQYNTGVMQPALQASQRAAAGTGQLYSGGEQQALQKTSQQGYYGFMTDYLNRLSTGSGASANPLGAAQLGQNVATANQQGVMQGVGAIGQGVSGLFGSGSTFANYGSMLSNNASMSAAPNYLQAAGQLSTPDFSSMPTDWIFP